MVLSSELISQVNVERPELPPAEIAFLLQWSLRDLVPIAATDLLVDYFDPPIQPPGKNEIHVVAASREFVQPILAFALMPWAALLQLGTRLWQKHALLIACR